MARQHTKKTTNNLREEEYEIFSTEIANKWCYSMACFPVCHLKMKAAREPLQRRLAKFRSYRDCDALTNFFSLFKHTVRVSM